ncbi:hypothetical protein ACTSKR_11280 [Chitinibacteraceae bacterium HSL-7]
MDLSVEHMTARQTAVRVPALQASLNLLVGDDINRATVALYASTRPAAGEAPGAAPVVTIALTAPAGVIDEPSFQLRLDVPLESQVTGADTATGSIPLWARISGPAGAWWSDASVSAEGGGGEIQLVATGTELGQPVARLYNGAFARLASAVLQG